MALSPDDQQGGGDAEVGMWQTIMEALGSNGKTFRLVLILLALGLPAVAAAARL